MTFLQFQPAPHLSTPSAPVSGQPWLSSATPTTTPFVSASQTADQPVAIPVSSTSVYR